MKPTLKSKFSQYFYHWRDRENGSIWIRVLILAILIGVFVTKTLPQLFTQTSRGRQSESRNNVGAMGRAQQAFYLENKHFTTDLVQLGIGIQSKTVNYKYEIIGIPSDKPAIVNNLAIPLHPALKANLSIVGTTIIDGKLVPISVVCESKEPIGKNPIWEGLSIREGEKALSCDCITVGGQPLFDISK
jgi:type IV pilus assembly protein PilA